MFALGMSFGVWRNSNQMAPPVGPKFCGLLPDGLAVLPTVRLILMPKESPNQSDPVWTGKIRLAPLLETRAAVALPCH